MNIDNIRKNANIIHLKSSGGDKLNYFSIFLGSRYTFHPYC